MDDDVLQRTIELVGDPDDHQPFAEDYQAATIAGYESTIKRGDGVAEHGYQSILLFLGMAMDDLNFWRGNLLASVSTKIRSKFEQTQREYLERLERNRQHAADKLNKKRNRREAVTFDPLASNVSSQMVDKKPAKPLKKPTSGAKGANRKYANEQAKSNTEKLF